MPTKVGWTAVHYAAARGHTECVKVLLAAGVGYSDAVHKLSSVTFVLIRFFVLFNGFVVS